jgi:hypothetical protein
VDAAARNDWELLNFLLEKKPNIFNLSFTRMCVREGYVEVVDWWKSVELIELTKEAAYSGHGECWIICTRMNIKKHAQI